MIVALDPHAAMNRPGREKEPGDTVGNGTNSLVPPGHQPFFAALPGDLCAKTLLPACLISHGKGASPEVCARTGNPCQDIARAVKSFLPEVRFLGYPASCFRISFPSFCVSPKNF